MAESYNGWPASPDRDAIGVVQSEWFPGGVKAGDVTTVLRYVAEQMDARVEGIVGGWCWGYNYRANVNNPSSLSCHASGTAIDWNAPEHPNGSAGTFTDAQVATILTILDEVEGGVSWLQGYDEMHFEICVDAAALAGIAARLGGGRPPEPEPERPPPGVNMFIVIDSVACIALAGQVMFQFRDWNTFSAAVSASPDIPTLCITGAESLEARHHYHGELFAQHVAAVTV